MAAAAPINRHVIDPTANQPPTPISPNLMQNVVTWIRDPEVPSIAKIAMAALYAFATLAVGAIFCQGLLAFSTFTTLAAIWGIREYSLQVENQQFNAHEQIRNLQQELAFSKVKDLFGGSIKFEELPVSEEAFQVDQNGAIIFIPENFPHPVMRGVDEYNRPFAAIKIQNGEQAQVLVLYQRYIKGSEWISTGNFDPPLNTPLREDDFTLIRNILNGGHDDYQVIVAEDFLYNVN